MKIPAKLYSISEITHANITSTIFLEKYRCAKESTGDMLRDNASNDTTGFTDLSPVQSESLRQDQDRVALIV